MGLSSNAAWLLGHLYTASTSSAITKTSGEYEKNIAEKKSVLCVVVFLVLETNGFHVTCFVTFENRRSV